MTWLRLDSGFPRHPKVRSLSLPARWAHIEAMCYAAEFDTVGYLRPDSVTLFATPRIVAELVAAGLWEANGDGWLIHDWADYQPDAAARRARAAERQRRHRARRADA